MGLLSTLLLPTLVAAAPLLALVGITQLRPVKRSASLTALTTLGGGLMGCTCTVLAIVLCANSLAQGMPANEPKCVTGAAVFLPIGVIFTLLALVTGICLTISRVLHKQKVT
jgi:hypothetical protein